MNEYKQNTGKQPVDTGVDVDVIFRDGSQAWNVPAGERITREEALRRNPDNTGFAQDWSIDGSAEDIVQWRLADKE